MRDLTAVTYIPDLTVREFKQCHLLYVGWLCREHPFRTGPVEHSFIEKLWKHCLHPVLPSKNFHRCDLCSNAPSGLLSVTFQSQTAQLGAAEIRVLDHQGRVYAAPDLIFHYVTVHRYRPPKEFIAAVNRYEGLANSGPIFRGEDLA